MSSNHGNAQSPPLPQDILSLSGLEDFANLAKNTSFDAGGGSDSNDSFSWYQERDADNFKRLTLGAELITLLTPSVNAHPAPLSVANDSCPSAPTHTLVDLSPPLSPSPKRMDQSQTSPRYYDIADEMEQPTSSTMQYPKPPYSFSSLISLALKNSPTGRLQVAEIYDFLRENFPYFRTARSGWKNSIRHNLSLNKMFQKIEPPHKEHRGRSCCLWTLNPNKLDKINNELKRVRDKDSEGVRESLVNPGDFELIERGLKGMPKKGQICLLHCVGGGSAPVECDGCLRLKNVSPVARVHHAYGAPKMHHCRHRSSISINKDTRYTNGLYNHSVSCAQANAVSSTTPTKYGSSNALPFDVDLTHSTQRSRQSANVEPVDYYDIAGYANSTCAMVGPGRADAQASRQLFTSPVQFQTSSPIREGYSAPPQFYGSYPSSPSRVSLFGSQGSSVMYGGAYSSQYQGPQL